jgi:hypothetical protein
MVLIGTAQNDKIRLPFILSRERNRKCIQTHQKKIVVMPQINIYEIKLDMI